MEGTITYHSLLGIEKKVSAVEYRKRYDPTSKNSAGIPLRLEDDAERHGADCAEAYEKLYDQRKDFLKRNGASVTQLVRTDTGGVTSVNFASVTAVPSLYGKLMGEPMLAVPALHWLRASDEKEWVFSHLCEAVHAYYSLEQLRKQMGEQSVDVFDDVRDLLREALYQYDHRHC